MTRWIVFLLFALSCSASAQLLTGVSQSNSGGGSVVAPSCAGVIDLSKGCALPMLGGVP